MPAWFWVVLTVVSGVALIASLTPTEWVPARIISGWILLCFIPGLAVGRLLHRRADMFELIAMGLSLSPLVVAILLYVLTFLLGLPFRFALIGVLAGIPVLLSTGLLDRRAAAIRLPGWPAALSFGALLLVTTLLVVHYCLYPIDLIEPHGLFHCAGIQQIRAGIIPPDNIHLYGAPAQYQWPCYLVPAAITTLLGISPPVAAAMLRLSGLFAIVMLGYLMARETGQGRSGRALSALLVIFGMNALGGAYFLLRVIASPELRFAFFHHNYHALFFTLFAPGFIPDYLTIRLSSMMLKLVNFSFIIPAYGAVMVTVLGVLRVMRRGGAPGAYVLILSGTLGALLFHPVVAGVIALPLPVAAVAAWLFGRRADTSFGLFRLLSIIGVLGASGLAALPYLLMQMGATGSGGTETGYSGGILRSLLWVFLPLGVPALFAVRRCWRSADRGGIFLIFFVLASCSFVVMQRLKCDWYILYLISVPLGLLAGSVLGERIDRIRRGSVRMVILSFIILIVLSGPLLRLNNNTLARNPLGERYRFDNPDRVMLLDGTNDLERAYAWARGTTSPRAVFVESPRLHSKEEFAALAGRRIYVGEPGPHSPGADDPMMADARRLVDTLLDPTSGKGWALQRLAALSDPVYLILVRDELIGRYRRLVEEYEKLDGPVRLVFDSPTVMIYRVSEKQQPN